MQNIFELKEWHKTRVLLKSKETEANRALISDFHEQAARVINATVSAHRQIVSGLLERLTRQKASLDTAIQTIHDQSVQHYNALQAQEVEARDAWIALRNTLETALNAERECTAALNERLAEYEAREAARSEQIPSTAPVVSDLNEKRAALPGLWSDLSPEEQAQQDAIWSFLCATCIENYVAKTKHPGTEALGNALSEETGEVMMALSDESRESVYKECVQVASTAMRIALEGDRAVDFVRARHGLDPLPGSPFAGPEWNGDGEITEPNDLRCAVIAAMMRHIARNKNIENPLKFDMSIIDSLASVATAEFGRWIAIHPVQE